jgi:NRPS condensation-like uncharacterized protein
MKLDNIGLVYPAVAGEDTSAVYRFSLLLTERVQAAFLQQALDLTLPRYPMLRQKLRKGLFWRYLEKDERPFLAQKDERYPCHPLAKYPEPEPLVRVLYYERRIAIEIFHGLTDGTGAVEFLKTLVFAYLRLKGCPVEGEGLVLTPGEGASGEESEDSFDRYYRELAGEEREDSLGDVIKRNRRAYQIEGEYFEPFGNEVVHGLVSVAALKEIAARQEAGVNEYLLALVIYMLYKRSALAPEGKRPLRVSVPVNLRQFFPSRTLRNFFAVTYIDLPCHKELSLEGIVREVKAQMQANIRRARLLRSIVGQQRLKKIMLARFLPLVLKDGIVRSLFVHYNDKLRTCTVSNMGLLRLPRSMEPYVESGELVFYPTAGNPVNCGLWAVKDRLTITFARSITDGSLARQFFTYLSQNLGLDVEVYGNEWSDQYRRLQNMPG